MSQLENSCKLVSIEGFDCVGISKKITRSHASNFKIISELWQSFNYELHKVKNRNIEEENWEKFGITYKQGDNYFYMASLKHNEDMVIPPGMICKSILKVAYARFEHTGSLVQIRHSVNEIYRSILPHKNIKPKANNKNGILHFERYDNRFNWDKADSVIEIFVSVDTEAIPS